MIIYRVLHLKYETWQYCRDNRKSGTKSSQKLLSLDIPRYRISQPRKNRQNIQGSVYETNELYFKHPV